MMIRLVTAAFLLVVSLAVQAQEVPILHGRINDYGNLLEEAAEQELEQTLSEFETRTTNQVVLLTVQSLEGGNLEEFSNRVFNTWKLGQEDADNGVLLLISQSDRSIRIEVGYGLEGELPDSYCGRIIRNVIAPQFKRGNYEAGIRDGLQAIIDAAEGLDTAPNPKTSNGAPVPSTLIFFLWLVGALLGVWVLRKLLRYRPRKSKSGQWMKRLSEREEDAYLNRQQQLEEKIGAADYDVWVSPDRSEHRVIFYKGSWKFKKCPRCKYRTYEQVSNIVVKSATYTSSGTRRKRYECANCKHKRTVNITIPRRTRSSSSSGGGWSSGGGSFGGGGFSGGGGSSGGGGASGGW